MEHWHLGGDRITVAKKAWILVWDRRPYIDILGADMMEYPEVSAIQLAQLESGIPEQINRVLSAITNMK
jgi:hypothetical protein